MADMKVELELVGPRAGQTVRINGHQFVNGVCALQGDAHALTYAIRYLGRAYSAFPRGSEELKKAKAEYEAALKDMENADGTQGDADTDTEPGPADEVHGSHEEGGGAAGVGDVSPGDGHASSDEGGAGVLPEGDGHQDPGVSEQPKQNGGQDDSPPQDVELAKAVYSLDPEVDDHWTKPYGLPKVSVVEEAYGQPGITRAMIEAAVPGWDREKAQEAKVQAELG